MKRIKKNGWVFYFSDPGNLDPQLDPQKVGKWMCFFSDRKFISRICEESINQKIVQESKHKDQNDGVACFYSNFDDVDSHKRIIQFFLENNLIRKTKEGKLYDISFKLDRQTRDGEYGDAFHSEIKLSKFVNLHTGEWIV